MNNQQKYALGIHTTTPELGLVMSNFVDDTRSQVWNLGRDVSSHIHQCLVDFILPQSWPDLQLIAVAKGPGGFTGTRIGVVIARTLGQQLNIPVLAISTLAAVAWHEKSQDTHLPATIAVEMPAQQGKVFGAIYQINVNNSGIKALLADQVFTLESWQETLNGLPNDYPVEYKLIRATSNLAVTVTSILHLAYLDWQQGKNSPWSDSLPYYGQQPVDG
ncbi:tRNA (adenosine(37)-N6)-threonylcarbamoyltransferase complex dimerization subunit type 1 TsaB [Cylindrospermopsis raciborskii]|uniref:tRNA (Adenosine(37)-N6)-threonylcarbamoyltransferase complex dimerization subunit type 1 TsaB n=1 Tax=Cylindrospermopsis raciborskii CENA302 TaxID=1170768 RepID=A0A9Q5WB43_9CYAN|nr:tRNA (adenosine(37)-N6)-threonylcarbamoyltransferase complex dimerization subunit type 1 TsaB [Cylindrospermopsis raciborskii]NLQ05215.1 tRNA (adenosine(37)-N6)-threonylcarbamoyltransferase complex dimerization subunit type 1 TsaB [Cylindrospermopsis raciborskii MVCC19]OHY32687.1 tRNA N6-adenosine(37)-N6-threonylcarbamoyltransferase complex dimerization subunit TsaB [Cylindrospermopsis raciborskii MVCC14]OPH11129.1 tRNA (adenosine(37)-N6)-threonylcarbamoyltransferase complex dimerization subu